MGGNISRSNIPRSPGNLQTEGDSSISYPSSPPFHRSGTIISSPQSSSAKMRFSQVYSIAIAAGFAAAEPLANVLAANNNTLSTLNGKRRGSPINEQCSEETMG
jgi:hypothetical protein